MRILYASLLLGLAACQIIGDPKDPGNDSASDSTTVEPDTTSTTAVTGTTSEGPDTGTSEGTTTEALPTTDATTTGGPGCDGLDELTCGSTAGCRPVFGAPFEFPGCTPLPAYLGCIVQTDCGAVPTTACRPDSLEVYLLDDTCVPPDLEPCTTMLTQCGEACLGFDEATCATDPNCTAHFGAPHVEENMTVCADFDAQQFLACDKLQPPCPPAVVTVCPIGQPDVAFDVASGCLPPGFEPCMDGPLPECP
ncbi:hypothetical protein SAMN02745121_04947 [Nannocystis exedens]|uniref:Uncharacterized protein n=1 Tax=Nannocystis exedens TaxID=54 RepID=A0A1I2C4P4_9BACT|nr:hypothetical protein [Nannocystis exedens]PCC71090.1 hypothetical protein NAEX_04163 [Nannocystis exedens]SFE62773.1 hypothetical protein SAMN02745121_04947 [Nannocystis exedens]